MNNTNDKPMLAKISVADPTALGLFGLAMVTLVASSQKLGLTTATPMILPWAIFLGAFAQLIAANADSKIGNTFGATAFAGYGLFWLGVALSWIIKLGAFGTQVATLGDGRQLGVAFIGYFIFTFYMTIGALKTNKVLFFIFFFIDFLFIGLALSTFGVAVEFSHPLAAWSELVISLLSFYGSAAAVLNTHFGRTVLPIGKAFTK